MPASRIRRRPQFESPDLVGTGHPPVHLNATRSRISCCVCPQVLDLAGRHATQRWAAGEHVCEELVPALSLCPLRRGGAGRSAQRPATRCMRYPGACGTPVHAVPRCMRYLGACGTSVRAVFRCMRYLGACSISVHAVPRCVQYLGACGTSVHAVPWCMRYLGACSISVHAVPRCMQYLGACGTSVPPPQSPDKYTRGQSLEQLEL
jgi:hypothetical protein